MGGFSTDFAPDFEVEALVPPDPTPAQPSRHHSPISAEARRYVRHHATDVMEYSCRITRGSKPEGYDEDTLIYTPEGLAEVVYEGICRIWEVSGASSVMVGDTDVYQVSTNLSIPWDTAAVVRRYDEVLVTDAPEDSQMEGKRFEIQTVAKAGEMRATRRFEITGIL